MSDDTDNPVDNPDRMPGKNGGWLKRGGNAGPGRLPSAVREAMRRSFEERIPILEAIADDTKALPSDRLRALDVLAKYGLGTTFTETDTQGNDARTKVIVVPPKLSQEEWAALAPVWKRQGGNGQRPVPGILNTNP